jgi:hypothetical protein
MFRVQHQIANQWLDLSRSPLAVFARGLAEVRRTIAAEDPVRVVYDPQAAQRRLDITV